MKRMEKCRQIRFNRVLYFAVMLSFVVPAVYLIIRMIVGDVPENEAGYH